MHKHAKKDILQRMAPPPDPCTRATQTRRVDRLGPCRSARDARGGPGEFGYALHQAQRGKHHPSAKQLNGDLRGLIELVDDFDGDTYRAIYTVKLAGVVYVLHVFQKKATHGIATPQREIALIKERWQRAKRHHAAHDGSTDQSRGGTHHGQAESE